MADVQIVSAKDVPAPSTYVIPKRAELVLKAVNAQFTDNGAAGDWLPAVVILSDSGDVIARAADQAVLVTGGDDAEVSWFPGVKNAGAGFTGLPWASASGPVPSSGYASGVVVTPQWGDVGLSGLNPLGNSAFAFVASPVFEQMYVTRIATYVYTIRLEWAASFAGNRYVEISVPTATPLPQRFEQGGTPEGDVMELSGLFLYGATTPGLVTVNVMQASGAPQDVTDLTVRMVAIPVGD